MVIATVRTTAKISVPIRHVASEALGPHHGVEQVRTHEQAKQEQKRIHRYTQSQKPMKATNAANAANPSRIIPESNITRLLYRSVGHGQGVQSGHAETIRGHDNEERIEHPHLYAQSLLECPKEAVAEDHARQPEPDRHAPKAFPTSMQSRTDAEQGLCHQVICQGRQDTHSDAAPSALRFAGFRSVDHAFRTSAKRALVDRQIPAHQNQNSAGLDLPARRIRQRRPQARTAWPPAIVGGA